MDNLLNSNYITGLEVFHEKLPAEHYTRSIPAIRSLSILDFNSPVTFFTGENGSGKSTLLEGLAVAYGFNPEGGTRNFMFSTRDTHSGFNSAIRLKKGFKQPRDCFFLRAESFYNVASQVDDYAADDMGYLDGYGGSSLHRQSHGESFLSLIQNRFGGRGLYILDEPEAALSPQRQLTALLMISRLAADSSQFFIVTHSPILLALPDAHILSFDGGEIHPVTYEETECYQVMEMFINSRQALLDKLFSEY